VRSGRLIGPWPALAAMLATAIAAAALPPPPGRLRRLLFLAVGLLLAAVALQRLAFDADGLTRMARMLRLRTLPFAFVFFAIVGAASWPRLPAVLRLAVIGLTLCGVPLTWTEDRNATRFVGQPFEAGPAPSARAVVFDEALEWIARDVELDTATILLVEPTPRSNREIQRLVDRLRQPALGGHGIELSSTLNMELVRSPSRLSCEVTVRRLRDYAVGYILSYREAAERSHFSACLQARPVWEKDDWWIVRTPWRWHSYHAAVTGFDRNATWTALTWTLAPPQRALVLPLPMARAGWWTAAVDGKEVAIGEAQDGTMRVRLAAGSRMLALRYRTPPGEWGTVLLGAVALVVSVRRVRRRS
jgi:hypothetical protein